MWCLLCLNVIAMAIFCQAHYINCSTSFVGCSSNNTISDVRLLFCQDSSNVVGKFVESFISTACYTAFLVEHINKTVVSCCKIETLMMVLGLWPHRNFALLSPCYQIPWYKQTLCSHCTSYPLLDLKCNQIVLHHIPYTKCSVFLTSLYFYAIYIFKYFNTLLDITC